MVFRGSFIDGLYLGVKTIILGPLSGHHIGPLCEGDLTAVSDLSCGFITSRPLNWSNVTKVSDLRQNPFSCFKNWCHHIN